MRIVKNITILSYPLFEQLALSFDLVFEDHVGKATPIKGEDGNAGWQVIKEHGINGYYYKSYEAWASPFEVPVYAAEHDEEGKYYTKGYFYLLAAEHIYEAFKEGYISANEGTGKEVLDYIEKRGTMEAVGKLAEYVFNEVDWQHPSTYLEEIGIDDKMFEGFWDI